MRRIGEWLRRLADRVDPDGAHAPSGLSFTIEQGVGGVVHGELGVHQITHPEPGCPLAFNRRDYDRAHNEARR